MPPLTFASRLSPPAVAHALLGGHQCTRHGLTWLNCGGDGATLRSRCAIGLGGEPIRPRARLVQPSRLSPLLLGSNKRVQAPGGMQAPAPWGVRTSRRALRAVPTRLLGLPLPRVHVVAPQHRTRRRLLPLLRRARAAHLHRLIRVCSGGALAPDAHIERRHLRHSRQQAHAPRIGIRRLPPAQARRTRLQRRQLRKPPPRRRARRVRRRGGDGPLPPIQRQTARKELRCQLQTAPSPWRVARAAVHESQLPLRLACRRRALCTASLHTQPRAGNCWPTLNLSIHIGAR